MKKDIIITALLTFCLTATIFMVATSNSAEYDPWVDLNGDGKIDIFDVVGMTSRYAATGNPAKNVTIAGHASKLAFTVETRPVPADSDYVTPWIPADGYSKLTVCMYTTSDLNWYRLDTTHNASSSVSFLVDSATNFAFVFVKTYDVPNRLARITFRNTALTPKTVSIDVYLIP